MARFKSVGLTGVVAPPTVAALEGDDATRPLPEAEDVTLIVLEETLRAFKGDGGAEAEVIDFVPVLLDAGVVVLELFVLETLEVGEAAVVDFLVARGDPAAGLTPPPVVELEGVVGVVPSAVRIVVGVMLTGGRPPTEGGFVAVDPLVPGVIRIEVVVRADAVAGTRRGGVPVAMPALVPVPPGVVDGAELGFLAVVNNGVEDLAGVGVEVLAGVGGEDLTGVGVDGLVGAGVEDLAGLALAAGFEVGPTFNELDR